MKAEEIKLHFQKLNEQKIELNLANDLLKTSDAVVSSIKRADNAWKSYQNYLTGADRPFKEMMSSRQILDSNYSKAQSIISSVERQAKELGVDASTLKGYTALKNGFTQMNDMFKVIDSFKDPSSFQ
jgi:hypothetical protein